MDKQPRYDFVDFLKGIGIFMVVWGHTMMPRSVYIYSFHMPLFFFLSGFLHKDKPFGQFFYSKVNALYIPYAVFTILSWVFYLGRHLLHGRYAELESHFYKLSSLFTGTADNGGNNPIWFLTCIFVVSIAFLFISRLRNPRMILGVVAGASLVGYLLSVTRVSLFFNMDIAFSGIVFYCMGYLVKQHSLLQYLNYLKKSVWLITITLAELAHIGTAYLNTWVASIDRVNMAGNLLGNFFLFYTSAFLGIFVFSAVGYQVKQFKIVNYLGMNSLVILATHKPLLLILNTYLGRYFNIPAEWYGFAATIAVLWFSIPLIAFINRKAPQVIGKKPLLHWEMPIEWLGKQKYLPN